MKESEPKVRNQEVAQLLDYGFSLYENVTLFKKGDVIEKVKIQDAKDDYVEVVCKEDVMYVQDKSHPSEVTYVMNYTSLVPPFKKDETIGYILLMRDDVNIASKMNDNDKLNMNKEMGIKRKLRPCYKRSTRGRECCGYYMWQC